jgi:hypothetical protein
LRLTQAVEPVEKVQLKTRKWETVSNQVVGHVLTFIDDDENKQCNRKRGYTEGIGVERF